MPLNLKAIDSTAEHQCLNDWRNNFLRFVDCCVGDVDSIVGAEHDLLSVENSRRVTHVDVKHDSLWPLASYWIREPENKYAAWISTAFLEPTYCAKSIEQ